MVEIRREFDHSSMGKSIYWRDLKVKAGSCWWSIIDGRVTQKKQSKISLLKRKKKGEKYTNGVDGGVLSRLAQATEYVSWLKLINPEDNLLF